MIFVQVKAWHTMEIEENQLRRVYSDMCHIYACRMFTFRMGVPEGKN
jgi:hypothetical protein